MRPPANGLEVRVLGAPSVHLDGRPVEITARKPLGILLALAVRREGMTKDELAETFWGPGRRANLRTGLYALRRVLAPRDPLVEDRDADVLRLIHRSDLEVFERRRAAGDHAGALAAWPQDAWTAGVGRTLLRGFALPEAPAFGDWLEEERERVLLALRACTLAHTEGLTDERELDAARVPLEALVDEDPLDEELHRRIMTLAWRAGDPQRALRQYETCRRALAEGVGLEPVGTTQELYEEIRRAPRSEGRMPGHSVGSGPAAELPFVGRRREREALSELLRTRRWVTLVGPGGVGKTRLARKVAEDLAENGDRPVAFVPLEAVHGADFAVAAVANATGVAFEGQERPLVQLARALRGRRLLIVLDDAEHLQPELGGAIDRLLSLAPDVNVLTTSRVASGRPAEHAVRIRGLDYAADPVEGRGREQDAVRLFAIAARRARPSFELDDEALPDVLRVCARLAGHPLGLRLAAGWLRFRTCRELADALDEDLLHLDNPGLAVEARHAGLRRVMESTWGLLEAEEATGLARLSVFRAGFDGAAAAEVADADRSVLAGLAATGWIDAPAPGRFGLNPFIREFGFERLRATPEAEDVEARHARLYLRRLADRRAAILGSDPREALDAVEAEWENVRAAWTYAARAGWTDELRAASEPLSLYADMRVRFLEAERMFAEALDELLAHREPDPATTVALLCGRGTHLYRLSRYDEALAVADEACRRSFHGDVDPSTRHAPRKLRGDVLVGSGRYAEALREYRAAVAASREGLPDRRSRDLRSLANVEAVSGMYEEAERHYRDAIALDRENGYRVGLAIDLNNLSELLVGLGRLDEAEAAIRESLGLAEDVDVHLVPYLELNLAELEERRGDLVEAASHARRCCELAERFRQSALRSRATARLASCELGLGGGPTTAGRSVRRALAIARESRESAAALHALVVAGRLARHRGEEVEARRLLGLVATHPAAEARDAAEAIRLLGDTPAPEPAPSLDDVLGELTNVA